MTTPTLSDLLQRLRSEPEWREQPYTGFAGDGHEFNPWIRKHNATRARLLAVVEARISEETLDKIELSLKMIDAVLSKNFFPEGAHRTHIEKTLTLLRQERAAITAQLAAVLK